MNDSVTGFTLSDSDTKLIDDWLFAEVYPSIVEKQLADANRTHLVGTDSKGRRIPYSGPIIGHITYTFIPTSLGLIFQVTAWDKTLDLSRLRSVVTYDI